MNLSRVYACQNLDKQMILSQFQFTLADLSADTVISRKLLERV
jgi:hypothetical protein